MKIPTNELFSKVLNIKFEEIVSINIVNNKNYSILNSIDIEIKIDKDLVCHRGIVRGYTIFYINIYELSHRCKEWAISKNISIESGKYEVEDAEYICRYRRSGSSSWTCCLADTEMEAIFNVCQSIFEENEDLL